jgi:DNA-binding NarL/FixJ family response regulator
MRLMLIDSDASRPEGLRAMLRFHALHVAADAQGALAKMREGGKFDAVLCDLRRSGMDAPAFHAALSRARPELAARVVFVTDEHCAPEERSFLRKHRSVCKPFDRADVERALMPFDPLPLL